MQSLSPRNPVVRQTIGEIFRSVGENEFERWSSLFRKSNGIDPFLRQPFHDIVARHYGMELPDSGIAGSRLLFAIQTFFAGVVRNTVRDELGWTLSDSYFGQIPTEIPSALIHPNPGRDSFGEAYRKLYPAPARKALGEFYTPDRLAEFLVSQIDRPDEAVLDPACGSGIFLLASIRDMLERKQDSETILRHIHGFDLNPLAVLMAKANLALTLKIRDERSIPVFLRDSILHDPDETEYRRFHILGNPPWLNWDRLPDDYREKTKTLWERYGLFSLSGNEARYGGAKKELAQLMILRVTDLYLKPGGRLAMVLPASVFQTRQAGEGFRRFRLPGGVSLRVLQIDDFSALAGELFPGVGTKPATVLLEKGSETRFPVPCRIWDSQRSHRNASACPVDPQHEGSPWAIQPDVVSDSVSKPNLPTTPSDYRAFLGANTGGANGVFWVEILGPSETSPHRIRIRNLPECGKLPLRKIEAEVEKELVFPLLRWGDVDRFQIRPPSRFILLPQDIDRRCGIDLETMQTKYPKTLAYLERFEPELRRRAAFRKYQASAPFYSMYNIGRQTIASVKVVWRRMDTELRAAVVRPLDHPFLGLKTIIPQETCVLIPCESIGEANYLVDRLNSRKIAEKVRSFSAVGSKGFGSPGILNFLGIRRFSQK